MQPPMSRVTKYSVISAVVLLAAIAGIIAKTVVQKTANPQKRPTIEEALRQVAAGINAVAPTQIQGFFHFWTNYDLVPAIGVAQQRGSN